MSARTLNYIGTFVFALALASLPLQAQTIWYVDDDNCPGPGSGTAGDPFCRIQDGIDIAVDGDTVQVADGSYEGVGNQGIEFFGKEIVLQSENGPANCVISCDDVTLPCLFFHHGEGPGTTVRGFTLTHDGYENESSGIWCEGSSPTIESNRIWGNLNYYEPNMGGGITCLNSDPVIQGNEIDGNYSMNGAGIYCDNSNATIQGNTIYENSATVSGGAICCENSSPSIHNNVIDDNWTDLGDGAGLFCAGNSSPEISANVITNNRIYDGGLGGGICCLSGASPLIVDNEISGNQAKWTHDGMSAGDGGGIYCGDSSPIIACNIIANNIAGASDFGRSGHGGGIACIGSSGPLVHNNLISGNTLDGYSSMLGYGGGIYCGESSSPLIVNNTICDNQNSGDITVYGGGIYCETPSAVIENCIVRGNLPDEIDGCDGMVMYSNVQGGFTGGGNIDADPLFVTGPDGDYYLSQVAAGEGADSPCLDAGGSLSANLCFATDCMNVCLDMLTTRTDLARDNGMVDMGYHYGYSSDWCTVSSTLTCLPTSGTVPFTTSMTVLMKNLYTEQSRTIAGRINVTLASGGYFPNWRVGYTNVSAGSSYSSSWPQYIPALGSLIGDNLFEVVAEDVTPAPYNQPPYPPSSARATDACTVTGIAP